MRLRHLGPLAETGRLVPGAGLDGTGAEDCRDCTQALRNSPDADRQTPATQHSPPSALQLAFPDSPAVLIKCCVERLSEEKTVAVSKWPQTPLFYCWNTSAGDVIVFQPLTRASEHSRISRS